MSSYEEKLKAAVASTGITGASFAYWDGAVLHTAVAGVRNSVTGDPVTEDTILHIGSITKVFNTALLMQLVDEGKVVLEDPVTKYLPDLRLRDMDALKKITCAMLVNHTNGIKCAWMADHGPDQERIADAVARCADLDQLHEPGEIVAYSNMGTVIAGYLTQTLRGESWYTLVKKRIFEPLGMKHALADLTDLPLFRCSVGDVTDIQTGKLVQTTRPFLSPSFAPAGATLMMTASDLVTFGRAMINGGVGPNGARILSEASAKRMAEPTGRFVIPSDRQIGLGWTIRPGGVLHHGGGGPGVSSEFFAHPASGRVLAVLRNCDQGPAIDAAIIDPIVESWTGLKPTELPPRQSGHVDPKPYVGVYMNDPYRADVSAREGGISVRLSVGERVYDNSPSQSEAAPVPLHWLGGHGFVADGWPAEGNNTEFRFVPGPGWTHAFSRTDHGPPCGLTRTCEQNR